MQDTPNDWTEFHSSALRRPSRELLRRTIGCFEIEHQAPGVAVDLGCGSGPDTVELLKRGWEVHAVDSSADGLNMLTSSVPSEAKKRLCIHVKRFEEFLFPKCDLIWASYSLPFCKQLEWPDLWSRMLAALRPNGRIAGDLFGNKHAFASEDGVMVLPEHTARSLFSGLTLEAFDIEDGYRPSGNELTRWHAFGFAARKEPAGDA